MNKEDITASSSAKILAATNKERLHMNNSRLDRELKSSIVEAALNEIISYKMAEDLIQALGYRGI